MAQTEAAVLFEGRDAGLKRAIGPWTLAASVLNITVGAGIFAIPAPLWREAGPSAPLAYLACTVMMAGVTLCFAAGGSRAPTSGGPYGIVEAAFGRFAGFVTAWLLWVSNVLACAGVAAGVGDLAGNAVPALAGPLPRLAVILGLLAALGAANAAGVGWGARLVRLATFLKFTPLALLLIGAAVFVAQGRAAPAGPAPQHVEFGRAMLLAIFAFQGMETAVGVSGEVRDPARNVPRALLGAMAGVAVLYMAIQLAAQRVLGPALAASTAPLADMGRAIWAPLGALLLAGTAASMVGYLAGDILGTPRLLFALGRDGLAPRALGRLHPSTAAPVNATLLHVGLAAALAATGGFVQLVVLAALSAAALYVIVCIAAVRLQAKRIALAGRPLHVPGLWLAAAVGCAGMAWLSLNGKPAEMLGLAALLVVCGLAYLPLRKAGVRIGVGPPAVPPAAAPPPAP